LKTRICATTDSLKCSSEIEATWRWKEDKRKRTWKGFMWTRVWFWKFNFTI